MERQNTMTAYAGRHRKTSAFDPHIERIVTKDALGSIIGDGILYVSLSDAATGNRLGVDFEPRATESLRRILNRAACA